MQTTQAVLLVASQSAVTKLRGRAGAEHKDGVQGLGVKGFRV